jgi:DNA-binding PadR family transcriptional regulator
MLTPSALHILVTLAEGSRHGYAIMKDVAARTSGEVKLNPGTLYTTIKRLVDEGLVAEAEAPPGDDERRRYYKVTARGRRAALAELDRLQSIIDAAVANLRPKHVR